MARRRLLLTDVFSVAIGAIARLLKLLQLSFDRHRFRISRSLAVAMACRAGIYRYVRRQAAQRACARDVDVASRAFQDVLAFAAFVRELCRDAFHREGCNKRLGGFMTAGAIRADWWLRFPMAFETSVVRPRHRLERMKRRWIRTRPRQRHDRQRFVSHVTKRTVVVIRLLGVLGKRLQSVMRSNPHRLRSVPPGNHVLMFVVRKIYLELALVFWLRDLIRAIRFAEGETSFFARRGAQVTYRTDRRASADRRLTFKKLRPVTTHARVVIREIRDIRKRSVCGPCRRNFVTSVALETLVFVGPV